ncbi:hypothetical protein EON63_01405 [archaeon]|nr:MAG: hypothetical protein EON63_01405 [archaeon]
MDVIPRTLVENSGVDATNMMHQLHAAVQGGDGNGYVGFDIDAHGPMDPVAQGVVDIYVSKVNAIR